MTDLFQGTSAFDAAPSDFDATSSEFDATSLDQNIRAITSVERTWRSPALPNEVKLDLAALTGASPAGIQGFLRGIDSDYNDGEDNPPVEEESLPPLVPERSDPNFERSTLGDVQVILNEIIAAEAPTKPTPDANVLFKMEAIERGYLDRPADGVVDNSWSPELNSIRWEMASDDYNRILRGDRTGAVPMSSIAEALTEWTSPGGLLASATELDLLPDFGAIGDEFSSWGDKFRKLGKSENPGQFASNLIDAVTGPVDDALLPILNVGLLFSGVGAVPATARIGVLGARATRMTNFVNRIYRPVPLSTLRQPSATALRWQGSSGSIRNSLGRGLESWRRLKPVAPVKQVVGTGMRLGVTSKLQDALPGYQGGYSLSDIGAVGAAGDVLRQTSYDPRFLPVELAFSPQNIFVPGTFLGRAGPEGANVLGTAARAAQRTFGNNVGRAAIGGAVGAGGGVILGEDGGDIVAGGLAGSIGLGLAPTVGRLTGTARRDIKAMDELNAALGVLRKNDGGIKDIENRLGVSVASLDDAALVRAATDLDLQPASVKALQRVSRDLRRDGGALSGSDLADKVMSGNRNVVAGQVLAGAGIGAGTTVLLDDDADAFDILSGAAVGGAVGSVVSGRSQWRKLKGKNPGAVDRLVGFVSDKAAMLDYKPLAQNQRVANAFHNALVRSLSGEALSTYQQAFNDTGSQLKAWKTLIGASDDDQAAAAMAYIMKAAAIDRSAQVWASFVKKGDFDHAAYHYYRNKLTVQSRMFDLSGDVSQSLDEAAAAHAWTYGSSQRRFAEEFHKIRKAWGEDNSLALEFMLQHNERARRLNRQLFSPEVITELDSAGEVRRIDDGLLVGMKEDPAENLGVLEAYLMNDTEFMNWNRFTIDTAQISHLDGQGLLDPAQLMPAYSRSSGMELGYKGYKPELNEYGEAVDIEVQNQLFRSTKIDKTKATGGNLAPFARGNGHGRFTTMRKDRFTAGDLVSLRHDLKEVKELSEALDSIGKRYAGGITEVESAIGPSLSALSKNQLRQAIKRAELDPKSYKALETIQKYLKRNFAKNAKMTGADLQDAVSFRMREILDDGDFWSSTGVNRFAKTDDQLLDGIPALDSRIKDLNKAIQYTAAEVDVAALARYYDDLGDAAKADEIRMFAAQLDEDGYRLVHGVEYQMPSDLVDDYMHFGDMTTKNMHAATLGNFFKGRQPAQARALEDRRQRVALASSLQDKGFEVAPDDDMASDILADLRSILLEEQDNVGARLRKVKEGPRLQRPLTYIQTGLSPLRMEDLTPFRDMVVNGLKSRGWVEPGLAEAAWMSIKKMRNTEFKDMGLYALEAKFRSQNLATSALKALGGAVTPKSSPKGGLEIGGSVGRAVIGAGVGAGVAAATSAGDTEEGARGRSLLYAGIGGALGGIAAPNAARALMPAAETKLPNLFHLGNTLVRARDALRFTISPFFDLSRYTEGLMLGQAASPLRTPSGQRFVMPVNASPTKLKKMISRNPDMLPDRPGGGRMTFDDLLAEYKGAAKGDYDVDVLDEAGRWFAQVGVLGFNPTDWMTAAYGHMRAAGFGSEEAYKNARNMYTYGTQGRSAAELSVNFIFFPFSFQKKALTHLGDFMADDLGRSLIVADAFKTYEILDERYDLNEMWRDHVPVMERLARLNLFAFGVSPGRFGGINAQGLNSAKDLALGTLFAPQGVSLKNGVEASDYQRLFRSAMPVVNDINWMMRDLKEQGYVLSSESALTTRAEIREGYNEWNEYKQGAIDYMDSMGFTLSEMLNKPYLEKYKLLYETKKSELNQKYPAWAASRRESAGNNVALDMEKRERLKSVSAGVSENPADIALYEFEGLLDQLQEYLRIKGYDVGGNFGWEDMPPESVTMLKEFAVEKLETVPGWKSVWEKFYRKDFGLLEAKI